MAMAMAMAMAKAKAKRKMKVIEKVNTLEKMHQVMMILKEVVTN